MDSIKRISISLQQVIATNVPAGVSTTSGSSRGMVLLAAGHVLTDPSTSSSGGATLGALLPSTTEQAFSSATSNAEQATLMGQTVGASLAEAGDSVNWREFASQAKSTLTSAGYNASEIAVYVSAVKQTYQTFQALPVSTTAAATGTSASAATTDSVTVTAVTTDGTDSSVLDGTDGVAYSTGAQTDDTDGVTSVAGGTTSTATVAIATNLLPATDLPASSFAALAQTAYSDSWASQGSDVDIDALVANTQTEMDGLGYTTDQVDNYMVGLFQAYNTVAYPSTSSIVSTTDTLIDGSSTTDGSATSDGTYVYDPNPPYDPLLDDGDQGY